MLDIIGKRSNLASQKMILDILNDLKTRYYYTHIQQRNN